MTRSIPPPTHQTAGEGRGESQNEETQPLLRPDAGEAAHAGLAVDAARSSTDSESAGSYSSVADSFGRESWTRRSLVIAYISLFLMAVCVSLEGQTVVALSAYATSTFKEHSLLSTILVIQGVINAVSKTPMAKFAASFGRFEAYCCCIAIYTLGYIQMASAQNVQTYASAQVFYAIGSTTLQVLQQIFIADTTDLLNRALFTRLPDLPYLFTVWMGPWLADQILRRASWRWGFGIWALLLPMASIPLIIALYRQKRRSRRRALVETDEAGPVRKGVRGLLPFLRRLGSDLDVLGLLLFTAGFSLVLIPISLMGVVRQGWKSPAILTAIVGGCISLVAFVFCERSKRLAPSPLIPFRLLKTRTVVVGCSLAFWYFMPFYFSIQPYLFSYLQVVHSMPVVTSGRITQTFGFMATVSAVAVSFYIKYARRYRRAVFFGCVLYIAGLLSMFLYRSQYSSTMTILASQIVVGAGGGIVNVSVQVGIQAASKPEDVAMATALFLTGLEMGGAVGSAVAGAVWSHTMPKKLRLYLPPETQARANDIFSELSVALSYPAGTATRAAINRSYQETMDLLMGIGTSVSLVIIPLALAMEPFQLPG